MSQRIQKINSLIQHELGDILSREIDSPHHALITITEVITSKDLRNCTVYISVFPEKYARKSLSIIQRHRGIQRLLSRRLFLKFLPKLTFKIDNTQERAAEIYRLLDKKRGDQQQL